MIKRYALAVVTSLLLLPQWTQAQAVCPFKATDPAVQALAGSAQSLLQGLTDAKNQCSEGFMQAVRSAQGLPALLEAVADPARDERARLRFINAEIARSLANPAYAQTLETDATTVLPTPYIDVLLQRQRALEQAIALKERQSKAGNREESRQKLLAMTSNLIAVSANTLSDPNSPCAKNVGGRYGAEILSVGLGSLSAAGALVSTAVGGAITITAGLLSELVNMFSRLSDDSLEKFVQDNQTKDLACLYSNIVAMSCSMDEKSNADLKSKVKESAGKIPNASAYSQALVAGSLISGDKGVGPLIEAIINQDLSKVLGGATGGTAVERLFNEYSIYAKAAATADDVAVYEKYISMVRALRPYYVPNNAKLMALKPSERTTVENLLNPLFVMDVIKTELNARGIQTTDLKGNVVPSGQLFAANSDVIESILIAVRDEKKGSTARSLDYATLSELHRGIDSKDTLARIAFIEKALSGMEEPLAEYKVAATADAAALRKMIAQSKMALKALSSFVQTPAEAVGSADAAAAKAAYARSLHDSAVSVRATFGEPGENNYSVRSRVAPLLNAPFFKFQQILDSAGNAEAAGLFSSPSDTPARALLPHERVKSYFDFFNQLADPTIQLADKDLVANTRTMFEAESSKLRKYFVNGIKKYRDEITISSSPEVRKETTKQLCALAYSLPNDDSVDHSIKECREMLPASFAKPKSRKKPDCTYMDYLRDSQRADLFETGRVRNLPTGNLPTETKK